MTISAIYPIIIPAYMCRSASFSSYVDDLINIGVKRIIISVDFDFESQTPFFHRSQLRSLRKYLSDVFADKRISFKVLTNLLLDDRLYSSVEISALYSRGNSFLLCTLPLASSSVFAMKNIFTIRNSGLVPIVCSFNDVAVVYPKSFCDAILSTENMSFSFDADLLSYTKNDVYIRAALSSHNNVIFQSSHFTASLMRKNMEIYFSKLPQRLKDRMTQGYQRLNKEIF